MCLGMKLGNFVRRDRAERLSFTNPLVGTFGQWTGQRHYAHDTYKSSFSFQMLPPGLERRQKSPGLHNYGSEYPLLVICCLMLQICREAAARLSHPGNY